LDFYPATNGLIAKLLRQLGMPLRSHSSAPNKKLTKWVSTENAEPPSLRHFYHFFFLHGKLLSRNGLALINFFVSF